MYTVYTSDTSLFKNEDGSEEDPGPAKMTVDIYFFAAGGFLRPLRPT